MLSCQAFKAEASPRRKGRKHNRSWADWDDNPELNGYATHLTDLAWPLLQNLGFSGAVGLVCAIAFKVFAANDHLANLKHIGSIAELLSRLHACTPIEPVLC